MRAAITGVGVVSAVGIGYREFSESLAAGVSGLGPWGGDESLLAGEVVDFAVQPYLIAEKTYLDRCSEFALAAVKLCLDHAGLTGVPADAGRAGLVIGTQYGCVGTMGAYTERIRKRGARFATPVLFSHAFVNTPASLVAIDYRLKGYHATVTSGPTSGGEALRTALIALELGHADAVLAGGVEALAPELVEAWRGQWSPADDPDAYDPFAGAGTVVGEGAAFLLLERLEHAALREAPVLAWLDSEADPSAPVIGHLGAGLASAPAGLYGDCLGAGGALAAAAGVAAVEQGMLPPVLAPGGDEDARREPEALDGSGVVTVADGDVRLAVRRA